MIGLVIAAALLAPVQDAPTAEEEPTADIVVIARKLRDWRASFNFRDGKGSCKIKRSTGDQDIDQIGCDAMLHCWPKFLPRYEATRAKGLSAAARKEMSDSANRDMAACVEERHVSLSAALAERRANREVD